MSPNASPAPLLDVTIEEDMALDASPEVLERKRLVQRIVTSRTFNRSQRLTSFLQYVTDRELDGRRDEITEQQIGVHVFGRPATYNPGDDNIVRTAARLLRQRLDQYFFEEGRTETIRLSIPRGAYVPVFDDRTPRMAEVPDSTEDGTTTPESRTAAAEHGEGVGIPRISNFPTPRRAWMRSRRTWIGAALLAGVAVAFVAMVLVNRSKPEAVADTFWRYVFRGDRPVILVPGDSGLVMAENLSNRSVTLDQYVNGKYRTDVGSADALTDQMIRRFGGRRYTSFPDLLLAARLASLPAARNRLSIRYARDMNLADLRTNSLILVGDPEGNPWVQLFEPQLNFRFRMDEPHLAHVIENVAPHTGEAHVYRCEPGDAQNRAYALVALVHSLDGAHRALLVEGTTMAGVEAATDFLSDPALLGRTILPAWTGSSGLRDFEVLLQTQNIDASVPGFSVIAVRVHP